MSKTIMTKLHGWTLLIDGIVKEHGYMTAMVFGIIWRHCQMSRGVCDACHKTLSEMIGVSRKTVCEHALKLVENGFLISKKSVGGTVTYIDTGKAGMYVEVVTKTDNPVTESGKHSTESYTNKTISKTINKTNIREQGVINAVAGNAQRESEHKNLSYSASYPSDIRSIVEIFTERTGITPTVNQKSFWIKGAREIQEVAGKKAHDLIARSVAKLRGTGMDISSPASLIRTMQSIIGKEATTPDMDDFGGYCHDDTIINDWGGYFHG